MQRLPVYAATFPFLATTASWRTSLPSSAEVRISTTSPAVFPCLSRSSPFVPYDTFTKDCVAMAPTPASAQDTLVPTENQWDCTATPISPVSGSLATIDYV